MNPQQLYSKNGLHIEYSSDLGRYGFIIGNEVISLNSSHFKDLCNSENSVEILQALLTVKPRISQAMISNKISKEELKEALDSIKEKECKGHNLISISEA